MTFEEIRIENTNACAFECFFCPRDKLSRKKGYMPLGDLELVLDRIGEHEGLVDLHGFGEPLLDRLLAQRISLVARRWPSATPRIYTTAGIAMPADKWRALMSAGLKRIEISMYGASRGEYARVHGVDRFDVARLGLESLSAAKKEFHDCEVYVRMFPDHEQHRSLDTEEEKFGHREWLERLGFANYRNRALHNFGNGRAYNEQRSGTCSVVDGYRKRILQITWEMDVIPCCFDFNATVVFGNLKNSSLEEIFRSSCYEEFIASHRMGNLSRYAVCADCEKCLLP